jgi:AmmeMemoRadiSam system protein A
MIFKTRYFSNTERRLLLKIARDTLEYYLLMQKILAMDENNLPEGFLEPFGTFVSLHKGISLRGCVGNFECKGPLYKLIQEMTIASAFHDKRFKKIKYSELRKLNIEISVLGPLIKAESPEDIILGTHGIYIRKGEVSGTFLPQVAVKTGWSKEEYLGHCAKDKAGLGWDGWKDADLYLYTAEVFNEKECFTI